MINLVTHTKVPNQEPLKIVLVQLEIPHQLEQTYKYLKDSQQERNCNLVILEILIIDSSHKIPQHIIKKKVKLYTITKI